MKGKERHSHTKEYNLLLAIYLQRKFSDEKGNDKEVGIDMYTLLYLKWITNKDLLYSTGNSA